MTKPVAGLHVLAPVLKDMRKQQERQAALAVICPPHPTRANIFLRAGRTQRGRWMFFEPTADKIGPDDWREHSECNNRVIDQIIGLNDSRKIEAYQGPARGMLFYYVEPEEGGAES